MIAAETTGRVCLGLELDPAYVDVIVTRWEAFTGGTARLDGEGLTLAEARRHRGMRRRSISRCADASRSRPSLKILEGNPGKRPIRGNEPQPPRSQPTCPAHLSPTAKAEWKRLAQSLNKIGLLTQVDRAALAAYCQSYGRWVEAERKLAETPRVAEDPGRLRPALALARDLEQAARADGEVHGGARSHAVVAQPARDQIPTGPKPWEFEASNPPISRMIPWMSSSTEAGCRRRAGSSNSDAARGIRGCRLRRDRARCLREPSPCALRHCRSRVLDDEEALCLVNVNGGADRGGDVLVDPELNAAPGSNLPGRRQQCRSRWGSADASGRFGRAGSPCARWHALPRDSRHSSRRGGRPDQPALSPGRLDLCCGAEGFLPHRKR